jgi:bifunctional ADP-heptose synthase (sugar kinase/adenylyltransferase)
VIVAEADLVAAVTRDRAAGKRIGLISLSFDLLKAADVRAVQAAAGRADRLVAALADDGSPHVISAADRAEIVDSLRGVDYVIVCAPERVDALAALLMPDVRA